MTIESARAALERKAKVYEKLMRGKSGGLSEKQYEGLLVDVRVVSFFFCFCFLCWAVVRGVRSDVVG